MYVYFIGENTFKRAECLSAIGCKIEDDLTKADLLQRMFDDPDNMRNISIGKHALTKSTFNRLVSMGYPFDEDDFAIIDSDSEESLRGMDFITPQWTYGA